MKQWNASTESTASHKNCNSACLVGLRHQRRSILIRGPLSISRLVLLCANSWRWLSGQVRTRHGATQKRVKIQGRYGLASSTNDDGSSGGNVSKVDTLHKPHHALLLWEENKDCRRVTSRAIMCRYHEYSVTVRAWVQLTGHEIRHCTERRLDLHPPQQAS